METSREQCPTSDGVHWVEGRPGNGSQIQPGVNFRPVWWETELIRGLN